MSDLPHGKDEEEGEEVAVEEESRELHGHMHALPISKTMVSGVPGTEETRKRRKMLKWKKV